MKLRKNRGLRFFPLANYLKARRDAQKYKRLFSEAFVERALAEARERLAKNDRNFEGSLVEWLTLYPLQSKTIEELTKWREDYREFLQAQNKKYREQREKFKEVRLLVNGRNRTYHVYE